MKGGVLMYYYVYQGKYFGKYNEIHTSQCRNEANELQIEDFLVFHRGDNDFEALEIAKRCYQVPEATACPKCMKV